MLTLDGAALDMSGREFRYDLPKPFGPKRGPAVVILRAKPAASQNTAYKQARDEILHRARVMDATAERTFKQDDDLDALLRERAKAVEWAQRAGLELLYDHCIVSWSTTVQSAGKDLEPTRENFLALAAFEHPEIGKLIAKIRKDLQDFDQFTAAVETETLEDEAGN